MTVATVSQAKGARGTLPLGVDLAALDGWNIVVSENASPSVNYAAREFQDFFGRARGLTLPIVNRADRPDRHVFIGPNDLLRSSNLQLETEGLGNEDLRIIIRDANIGIAGGEPRGTLYGVYTFLEDYLGVRFLTAEHTHVPNLGPVRVVGPVDRIYRPPLEFRWSCYQENEDDHAFAARLRVNTLSDDPKLGGRSHTRHINHSLYRQCKVRDYGETHPEYFALVDGQRKLDVHGGGPQLCLSNPDVEKIVTESVKHELDEDPSLRNVSVSQMDNTEYCRCTNCAAIDAREGTPTGSMLSFVNTVTEEITKHDPNVMIGTLAYQYTRDVPKTVRPGPNVQIWLCSIECCVIHAIDDPGCPNNVKFCKDMADWGQVTDKIFVWNYNTIFANWILPVPNMRVIEPNVRYLVSNNTKGLFMQAVNGTVAGEFSDLRNYVTANLSWDPNRDGTQLMNEFLGLHYGPAAPPIKRFIEFVHDYHEAQGAHIGCGGRAYEVGEEIGKAGIEAFGEALKLANSDELRRRVEQASICAYRAAIEPIWYVEYPNKSLYMHDLAQKTEISPEERERMRPLVQRFLELCDKYKMTRYSEGGDIEIVRISLRKAVGLEGDEE